MQTRASAHLGTHITHPASPVPIYSAVPSCVHQTLALGLSSEMLQCLASCVHDHL